MNIFKYPDVLDKFKSRLDHPISLDAYKSSNGSITESPFTRKPINGGFCLSANPEHIRASAWALAYILTGNKLVGNQDLWFAVIMLMVQRGRIEYLKPILPQLQAQMKYRMEHHKTYISLTGLPEFPTTQVPLGTAIWYIFSSPLFNVNPKRDILRTHLPHLNELRDLVELIGYKVPDEIEPHVLRLRCMLAMLGAVKREISSSFWKDTVQCNSNIIHGALHNLTMALVQNCAHINPDNIDALSTETPVRFIPIDGKPSEEQIEKVYTRLSRYFRDIRKLYPDTIYSLSQLVNTILSAGDISIPFTWKPTVYTPINNWFVPENNTCVPVPICPKTCRPYYMVKDSNNHIFINWEKKVEEVFHCKPIEVISINNMINRFVERYIKYPNAHELLLYIYNRLIVYGVHETLTVSIETDVKGILSDYKEIMESTDVEMFIKKLDKSRNREDRVKIEQS